MRADLIEKLTSAIVKMAEQSKAQPDSQKALHFSQSALNFSHVAKLFGFSFQAIENELAEKLDLAILKIVENGKFQQDQTKALQFSQAAKNLTDVKVCLGLMSKVESASLKAADQKKTA